MIDRQLLEDFTVKTLPKWVVDWIEEPEDAPLKSDTEYVRCLCVQVFLHDQLQRTRDRYAGAVFSKPEEELKAGKVIDTLQQLVSTTDRRIEQRLSAGQGNGWVPRLERLARLYDWTDRELAAFRYMIVQTLHLAFELLGDELHHAMTASGMTAEQAFRFVDTSRPYMREGVFDIDKGYSTSIFSGRFKLHDEVVKALVGADLTTDDLLKLDGTTLSRVLMEEPGFVALGRSPGSRSPTDEDEEPGPVRDLESESNVEQDIDGEERVIELPDGTELELPRNAEGPLGGVAARLEPYTSDLEYLEDHFRYIAARIRRVAKDHADDDSHRSAERSRESILRELLARERVLRQTCEHRVDLTRQSGGWQPRVERLVRSRGLDEFEKWVLLTLVGIHLSDEVRKSADVKSYASVDVGDLLTVWTEGLEDQIQRRKHFYKSGTLVKEGLIRVESGFRGDLQNQDVEIDRRMMDFIAGLDSESSDLVEGSHLYTPHVRLDQVILPADQKKLVLDTIGSFDVLQQARQAMGFDDAMAYGRGLVMLFYGPSGTGKTMLANAIGNHLGKKIFLINFPSLGSVHADEVLAMLFREARIHEAILFFDECESLFESRDLSNPGLSTLLTAIERHDGPIIMATNRPFDLDEAMNRRITLAIEFRVPDPHLRADIWRVHLPQSANLADDVDVDDLARRYELAGGFIKNAVKSALAFAVARDPRQPLITHDDLDRGARLQLRTRLRMADLDRRIVPTHGLDWLVVSDGVREVLREVVSFEKARRVLYGQWGFDRVDERGQGVIAIFHGLPGTGKTQAAECIAFEIGRPLRMVNPAELLSKYVGDTAKNIDSLFTDLRNHDAVLLFEEAEGLFGRRTDAVTSTDRFANVDTGLLLHHIERYPGLVILTTNMLAGIDPAFQRRMRYVVEFPTPSESEREELWRRLLPNEVPLGPDVDLCALAARFSLTGGSIKNAVYRAAARAALRGPNERVVTMNDLLAAASDEAATWERRGVGFAPTG